VTLQITVPDGKQSSSTKRKKIKNKNSVKRVCSDKRSASATHHMFYVLNIMALLTRTAETSELPG
jgi:hypothetical protein